MTRRDSKLAQAIGSPTRELLSVSQSLEAYLDEFNDVDIATLITFFTLLDSWDREERNAKNVQ